LYTHRIERELEKKEREKRAKKRKGEEEGVERRSRGGTYSWRPPTPRR
jgi:hypothetical protein